MLSNGYLVNDSNTRINFEQIKDKMNSIWISLAVFFAIYVMFACLGMNPDKCDEHIEWCNQIMLDSNFDPPEIHIYKASRRNCIKLKDGIAYIYLKPSGSELEDKRTLIYLLAYTCTDKFKDDQQYYTNLEVLFDTAGINRAVLEKSNRLQT